MKKILKTAAAVLLLASCTQRAPDIVSPAAEVVDMTIGASIEPGTRTMLDDGMNVVWSSGDAVGLFLSDTHDKGDRFTLDPSCHGSVQATFHGSAANPGTGEPIYYACYPYDEATAMKGGKMIFSVPDRQEYVPEGFAPGSNPMVAYGADPGALVFKNVFGIMALPITGPADVVVTSIKVESANQWISGRGDVGMFYGSGSPVWTNGSQSSSYKNRYVILQNINQRLDPLTPTTFYIVVPPQSYTGGITITVSTASSGTMIKESNAEFVIKRATVKRFSPIGFQPASIDKATAVYYGRANCIEMTDVDTVSFDCSPYYTVSENFGYDNLRSESLPKVRGVKVLWSDNPEGVFSVSLNEAQQTVGVTRQFGAAGNAVVAAYADAACKGDIVWSFHVWAHAACPDKTLVGPGGPLQLMAINLGALTNNVSPLCFGLYYQWGRKDPMRGVDADIFSTGRVSDAVTYGTAWPAAVASSAETGTVEYSVKHPMTFIKGSSAGNIYHWIYATSVSDLNSLGHRLWGNPNTSSDKINPHDGIKSVYDPCPEGYRVMPDNAVKDLTPEWNFYFGRTFRLGKGAQDASFFPAAGCRAHNSGVFGSVGTEGFYWTNSMRNSNYANYLYFDNASYEFPGANPGTNPAAYARSVRCVKI